MTNPKAAAFPVPAGCESGGIEFRELVEILCLGALAAGFINAEDDDIVPIPAALATHAQHLAAAYFETRA